MLLHPQPNYLDPQLQTVKDELMPALYKQLQSGNNAFAVSAIRILGKLGGRNRRLLRDQAPLEGKDNREVPPFIRGTKALQSSN